MEDLNLLLEEYKQRRTDYVDFALRLKTIVGDILEIEGRSYLSIEARAKSPESLKGKLEKKKFKQLEEVQDLAGVRVIAYVYEDVEKIEHILSKNFDIKELEVEEKLGTDKVGYRSHHWLVTLSEERVTLPEYQKFRGFRAELQVRTVLQHAWAQIGHNQVYKPSSVLPLKIKRDFQLLAGLLEIADNEFNRISSEISNHQDEVIEQTEKGNLEIPIDSISIRTYFDNTFGELKNIAPVFGPNDDMAEEIIEELKLMDIHILSDLKNAVTDKVKEIELLEQDSNYAGVARTIMILHDKEKYFAKAWKKKWTFSLRNLRNYKKVGLDFSDVIEKYQVPCETE